MYALKSLLLTTASLLSINCRVMYQNTANDNFSFKRTCRPYLWPLRVMSVWLMKDVCVRMCACGQTECPRRHRRRGMATDVPSVCLAEGGGVDKVSRMSVCATPGRWGRHQRELKLNNRDESGWSKVWELCGCIAARFLNINCPFTLTGDPLTVILIWRRHYLLWLLGWLDDKHGVEIVEMEDRNQNIFTLYRN